MKETCWKLFCYLIIDHRAAQAWLNRMAEDGWELVHIYFGLFARFRRTERTDLSYFLDWADPKYLETSDYLQLCSDAGWEPVQTVDDLNLYASRPGTSPAPIQTDSELEYRRFRQKALRRMALGGVIAFVVTPLILLPLLLLPSSANVSPQEIAAGLLSSSLTSSLILFCLPFWLAGGLAYLALLAGRLLRWRQAVKDGRQLPVPTSRTAGAWGKLKLLGEFSLSLMLLLLLPDALLNGAISLSNVIGLLIGCAISISLYRDNSRLFRRVLCTAGCLALLLLCILLHSPVRNAFPGRLPPSPVLADTRVINETRADTLLGSHVKWEEFFPRPDMGDSKIGYPASVTVEAQTWVSPVLADWAFGTPPSNMVAVPGRGDTWQFTGNTAEHGGYRLRRGNTLLTLSYYGDLPADPLSAALAWLDGF